MTGRKGAVSPRCDALVVVAAAPRRPAAAYTPARAASRETTREDGEPWKTWQPLDVRQCCFKRLELLAPPGRLVILAATDEDRLVVTSLPDRRDR
ncbi:MAG: hypothetical protein HY814_07120 [Candidatus Riflebacteria bacterium]|nr:hypothetical protein [Candidatus Riflebacteria bacterium]